MYFWSNKSSLKEHTTLFNNKNNILTPELLNAVYLTCILIHRETMRPLTDVPGQGIIAGKLFASNDVPDTGQPVCQQGKYRHQ